MNVAARSVADELVLTRDIAAPRERVFAAWTDARAASRWWAPQDFTPLSCEMDVRPGGAWRRRMRAPDGTVITKWGVYREVVAPERLVFTYSTESAGRHRSRDSGDGDLRRPRRPHAAHAAAYRVRKRRGASRPPGRLEWRPGAPDDVHRDGGSSAMSKIAIGAPARCSRRPRLERRHARPGGAGEPARRDPCRGDRPAVVRERHPDAARHDLPHRLDDQADHGGGDPDPGRAVQAQARRSGRRFPARAGQPPRAQEPRSAGRRSRCRRSVRSACAIS